MQELAKSSKIYLIWFLIFFFFELLLQWLLSERTPKRITFEFHLPHARPGTCSAGRSCIWKGIAMAGCLPFDWVVYVFECYGSSGQFTEMFTMRQIKEICSDRLILIILFPLLEKPFARIFSRNSPKTKLSHYYYYYYYFWTNCLEWISITPLIIYIHSFL